MTVGSGSKDDYSQVIRRPISGCRCGPLDTSPRTAKQQPSSATLAASWLFCLRSSWPGPRLRNGTFPKPEALITLTPNSRALVLRTPTQRTPNLQKQPNVPERCLEDQPHLRAPLTASSWQTLVRTVMLPGTWTGMDCALSVPLLLQHHRSLQASRFLYSSIAGGNFSASPFLRKAMKRHLPSCKTPRRKARRINEAD